MPDGAQPAPGGWNRIELVDDLSAEVERLAAQACARNDIARTGRTADPAEILPQSGGAISAGGRR
jgi:hypothetical protein